MGILQKQLQTQFNLNKSEYFNDFDLIQVDNSPFQFFLTGNSSGTITDEYINNEKLYKVFTLPNYEENAINFFLDGFKKKLHENEEIILKSKLIFLTPNINFKIGFSSFGEGAVDYPNNINPSNSYGILLQFKYGVDTNIQIEVIEDGESSFLDSEVEFLGVNQEIDFQFRLFLLSGESKVGFKINSNPEIIINLPSNFLSSNFDTLINYPTQYIQYQFGQSGSHTEQKVALDYHYHSLEYKNGR